MKRSGGTDKTNDAKTLENPAVFASLKCFTSEYLNYI